MDRRLPTGSHETPRRSVVLAPRGASSQCPVTRLIRRSPSVPSGELLLVCKRRFFMKKLMWSGFLVLVVALTCMGQMQQPLCPKHIETPAYPPIARTAHVSGIVALTLTIDADGRVSD